MATSDCTVFHYIIFRITLRSAIFTRVGIFVIKSEIVLSRDPELLKSKVETFDLKFDWSKDAIWH